MFSFHYKHFYRLQTLHACLDCLDLNQATLDTHCIEGVGAAVIQEVKKSFSNQKVASSTPCRSVLEQDTEDTIAPDVQCAISVNEKNVYTSL